jgi:hypothetical protein
VATLAPGKGTFCTPVPALHVRKSPATHSGVETQALPVWVWFAGSFHSPAHRQPLTVVARTGPHCERRARAAADRAGDEPEPAEKKAMG